MVDTSTPVAPARPMLLKRRVMDSRQRDEISEALAETKYDDNKQPYTVVPSYRFNYYPPGLRERILGTHSKQLVGVTRHYLTLSPEVIVDFEPNYPDKWYYDEKAAFFGERGLVYVPVALNAKYTEDEFKLLVESCRSLALSAKAEFAERTELAKGHVHVEDWMQDPALVAEMDAEAVRTLEADLAKTPRSLHGAARAKFLGKIKKGIVDALREDLKRGRLVDPFDRYRQPAPSAGG